ncbi:PP-loop family [Musa troglodytarum]|uniref:PP-loop family n=1 Tax=Musa troglodytarum TaxID=320322 RepID=A0A9E7GP44_9LILI|nr:PP-loop family [Musa troglodytarum]
MELKWGSGRLWPAALVALAAVAVVVAADRGLRPEAAGAEVVEAEEVGVSDYVLKVVNFLWRPDESSYQHVWPSMKFGWEIVVGTIIGFLGSAFGSVGGVGGGGIYVPMLTLIIGFDAKSSTAISKCMIMGAAGSTVWYNLKLRHPTLDMPIIDYDLALLFQPMLMLGISIGVTFNVIFADWMVTVLLIILFIGRDEIEYKALPSGPGGASKKARRQEVPVSLGVSGYEAVSLYRGKRIISSKGEEGINFTVIQLIFYCLIGVLAGVVGGLLGLGGGFILGPVFLELGVPPQVSSATATFAMTFSSSMSVVEYYLLKRFPIPYALYFVSVALVAAFVGQHLVKRLIEILGRASLIIFILASTIFISAISLGGVGISNMVQKIQHHEYMGFENLCKYEA